MTRKSKRELEREITDLSDSDDNIDSGILIVYEDDDGKLRDSDDELIPNGAVENATVVLQYEPKEPT
jgi:hypothetical protein